MAVERTAQCVAEGVPDEGRRGGALPSLLKAAQQPEVIGAIRCSRELIMPQSEVIRAMFFGGQSIFAT